MKAQALKIGEIFKTVVLDVERNDKTTVVVTQDGIISFETRPHIDFEKNEVIECVLTGEENGIALAIPTLQKKGLLWITDWGNVEGLYEDILVIVQPNSGAIFRYRAIHPESLSLKNGDSVKFLVGVDNPVFIHAIGRNVI